MSNNFYKHKIENLVSIDKIITLHYLEYPYDYVFEGEQHDFWEVVYVDKGHVICSRDRREEFSVKQGQLLFHKPNEFHTIRADGVKPANIFVYSFVSKSEAMGFFDSALITLDNAEKQIMANVITEALSTFKIPVFQPELKKFDLLTSPALGGQQMLRINMEMLFIRLMRRHKRSENSAIFVPQSELPAHIETRIIDYLKQNIYAKLTLDMVCTEFNYGKTFLCAAFKDKTGTTIYNYYRRLKIDEAKRLIRGRELNNTEIAYKLGFESYSHFTKSFKRFTKHTPNEYRRMLKI